MTNPGADEDIVQRDLVELAQQGDREAFNVLAASLVDGLYATARVILRDADRAEDAAQEALVRCWRDLPSLRDPARFDPWIRRLLMRAITDELRRGHRFEAKVRILKEEPSVAATSTELEDRDLIERAFRRLSLEHRVILTLHHLHGLTLPELAESLDIPVGTAKSRLHYALGAMRASLEADDRTANAKEASA